MHRSQSIAASTAALVLILAASCTHGPPLVSRPPGTSRSLVLRNVRVFDAPHAAMLEGLRDIVVRDGRIAEIGAPGLVASGLREIDGRGGTLLPGLVDVHTHTASTPNPPWKIALLPDVNDNLAAFLYAGVTTVLDLGNLSPAVFQEREKIATGSQLGPHLYAAGPIFTAPGGHPAEVLRAFLPWYLRWYVLPRATREVATPDEARRAVAALVPEHPDILKIAIDAGASDVPRLSPEMIAAIVAAGHQAGVRSIAHIGSSAEAVDAVRAGVDALAHSPWRDELSDEAFAIVAKAHVPVVLTLAIWDVSEGPRADASAFLPIEREVAQPGVITALLETPPRPEPATAAFLRAVAAAHDIRRRNVRKLRAAGVPILAGSDACNAGEFPGAGLHLELTKMVQAGFTPGEALHAATWENAHFLAGENADFGEIAVGKRADLVLVAGDPATRIDDLGKIAQVILDGTVLERHGR